MRKTLFCFPAVLVASSALLALQSQHMTFKKVEVRTEYGRATEGKKGKLLVDSETIRFVKDNEREEYFSIPADAVNEIFYSRVSGRRIKTAIAVTPFLLFSKGKKHYMTLSFDDGGTTVGAVEFRLDKKNYRGVLRAIEQVAGVEMQFDQEGIKDEKETVASRASDVDMAVLKIETDPEGAEIEIDGAFAGMTPRTKRLPPGEHKVKLKKKGFKTWEKKIQLEAGEEFPLRIELEP